MLLTLEYMSVFQLSSGVPITNYRSLHTNKCTEYKFPIHLNARAATTGEHDVCRSCDLSGIVRFPV